MLSKILRSALLLLIFATAYQAAACQPRSLLVGAPQPTHTPRPTRTSQPTRTLQPTPTPVELAFPIRAAFYEPGYPGAWGQNGEHPFTRYHPALGFYNLDEKAVVQHHIVAMQYGKIQAAIAAWPGPGQGSDARVPVLLETGAASSFYWALQAQSERQSDPSVEDIRADLAYIRVRYSGSPAYLRLGGRFVVFVESGPGDGCGMVDRWQQASGPGAYVVLQTFEGYQDCPAQPDGWYPALADGADSAQTPSGITIRPGLWRGDEDQPALSRDLRRWAADIRAMAAAGGPFQLIATFNGWGEGSAVEDAQEWPGMAGFGQYLDALHFDGDLAQLFPYPIYLPFIKHDVYALLVGAGDIAVCPDFMGARKTASLLERYPDAAIFTAGDNTQSNGTEDEFRNCFDPSWGRFKSRIHPSPGNHDANTDQLAPYFNYFGDAAGERGKGYYSYELGDWHVISLNSNCELAGGCRAGSPQEQWLKADLAVHPAGCTLAYWHAPMFNSGHHGNYGEMIDLWRNLYDAGAELIINGHDHHYERFAPQDPDGNADPERGIREFIVGTGGAWFQDITWDPQPNSEVIIQNVHGLLKLELISAHYNWEFVPVPGSEATDAGTQMCH